MAGVGGIAGAGRVAEAAVVDMCLRDLFDLTGRTALVTLGPRGLRLQIAKALGEFGARVLLVSRHEQDRPRAVDSSSDEGIAACYAVGGLSSAAAVHALIDQLAGTSASGCSVLLRGLAWCPQA